MTKKRYAIIDIWISILLCLVLLGHCSFPNAPSWYVNEMHLWIYCFHMASFFFVCGFLVANSYRDIHDCKDYLAYVRRRLLKFGIPYLFFGLALCVFHSLRMKNGDWAFLLSNLRDLFVNPIISPSGYLWFIYLLLEFYILAPVFCQAYQWCILPGITLSIFLYFHPLPQKFCLQLLSTYMLFFLCGIVVKKHLTTLLFFSQKVKKENILQVIIVFLWIITIFCFATPVQSSTSIFPSLLSIPGMYIVSQKMSKYSSIKRIGEFLSKHCYTIYLWQMVCIQLWAIVLFRICKLPHWILLVTVIPIGIGGSLLADYLLKYVMNRMIMHCFSLMKHNFRKMIA